MKLQLTYWAVGLTLFVVGCSSTPPAPKENLPTMMPFVSIADLDPTISVEARYFGTHNFVGRPIKGYKAAKCLLTKEAAMALVLVQSDLKASHNSLKVYDCYRPQKAVNDFVEWSKDANDQKMKNEFYPRVDKKDAFKLGYIAEKSGHSRGSTVDLTIVSIPMKPNADYKEGQKLIDCTAPHTKRFRDNSHDMGTGYDCFDPMAATASKKIGKMAKTNRAILKAAMEKRGFKNYENEWWHFTLANEPHPNTYFDIEVE